MDAGATLLAHGRVARLVVLAPNEKQALIVQRKDQLMVMPRVSG